MDVAPSLDRDPLFSAPSSPAPADPSNQRKLQDASSPVPAKVAPQLSIHIPTAGVMPPAAKSATTPQLPPSAGPPNAKLPSHREREKNPRVQPMPMPVSEKGGAAGISTKQKIAQRAGVKASLITASMPPPGPEALPKKSLAGLSFKKKTTAAATSAMPSPTVPVGASQGQKQQQGSSKHPSDKTPAVITSGWGDGPNEWHDSAGDGWGDSGTGGWVDSSAGGWGEPLGGGSGSRSPVVLTADTVPLSR